MRLLHEIFSVVAMLKSTRRARAARVLSMIAILTAIGSYRAYCEDSATPLLDLMLKKGLITEAEAAHVRAEAENLRTNPAAMPPVDSKWRLSKAIKEIELFGDVRVRYEERSAKSPGGQRLELNRARYSVRFGLKGEVFDDFYYGIRLDTSANGRSGFDTLSTSVSGVPYQGPYGKSTAGIYIGQAYLGWKPWDFMELVVGRMPNPLYTSTMVWDSDLNPEGAAEKFKYSIGELDLFATFGQFLYQDSNPSEVNGGLGFNGLQGQQTDNIFQLAWEGGFVYHLSTNVTIKAGANVYQYIGLQKFVSPYFGDDYVGEGAYEGPGSSNPVNGSSGYGTSYNNPVGFPNSLGFPNNQVGLNDLMVVEVPFQLDVKLREIDTRVFGDYAYNLDGRARAQKAANGYNYYLANFSPTPATIGGFSPQTQDVSAYQIGFAIASKGALGLANGSYAKKHAWHAQIYWQHIEQYALDPNLLDSDFFEGRANMEGLYTSLAYGFTDALTGTIRYGYADRINRRLGTGGSNQDIPQVNSIDHYDILQMDLSLKF